jgi:hypothetical protein
LDQDWSLLTIEAGVKLILLAGVLYFYLIQ